jgi:hypothetical protein
MHAPQLVQRLVPLAMVILLPPTAAAPLLRDDPKRPVHQISHDLGVSPEAFRTCFAEVQPAEQGDRPTQDRVHSNKSVLLNCLRRSNPSITNETLDAVMDRYRPGGRAAQEPRP